MIVTQTKKDYGNFDPMNWVGIIENAHDPLNIGMYKVRIIGLHSPNIEESPVDNLPWAHAVVPLSTGSTTSIAREGEWVVGYFLDPETLQYPIIVGILPGIQSTSVINITSSASRNGSSTYGQSAGFVPQLTQEQADKTPKLPPGVVTRADGQPTTSPLARGEIANSTIALTNNAIEHVCDFKKKLRFDIAKEKMLTYQFVQQAREAIKQFFAGLSSGPMGTAVQVTIRQIKEVLKMIKKAADFITDVVKATADFLKYCNQILAYIASLPAKLAQMLKKCVQEFTDALSELLSFDDPNSPSGSISPFGEIKDLFIEVQNTAQSLQNVVSATTETVAQAQSLAYTARSFGRV
jgi:hypothetical protein